jgi:hypothetical protein
VTQSKIWLHMAYRGWHPNPLIEPDTDLDGPAFEAELMAQFGKTRRRIDELVEREREKVQ